MPRVISYGRFSVTRMAVLGDPQGTLAEPRTERIYLYPDGKEAALISGLIAFYLIAIFCWGLPLNSL